MLTPSWLVRARTRKGAQRGAVAAFARALVLLLNLVPLFVLALSHDKDQDDVQRRQYDQIGTATSRRQRRGEPEADTEQTSTATQPPLLPPHMSSIKLTRFHVPNQVRPGDLRRLTCLYEMQGATLHAVKLFKDNKEFYRYMPNNQKLVFQVPGVQVDVGRSNGRDIWLRINRRSSGAYKCQVSVENTFNSVSAERRMDVLDTGQLQPTGAGEPTTNHADSLWPYASQSARPRMQPSANGGAAGRAQQQQPPQQAVRQQASQAYDADVHSGARATTNFADNNHSLQRSLRLALLLALPIATHLVTTTISNTLACQLK